MNAEAVYQYMRERLARRMKDEDIRDKAAVAADILRLKHERRAAVLVHNYMEPALYHSPVPDLRGDSLELSRKAAQTKAETLVVCGVGFMAETVKLLNPERTVLLPVEQAGCSLADSLTAAQVRALRTRFPGAPVVTYVNTSAAVKAESDLCCTSGNAVDVIASMKDDRILFLPDRYLAASVARRTGRRLFLDAPGTTLPPDTPGPWLVAWPGACEVHELFTAAEIAAVRQTHPGVRVLCHLECPEAVADASDYAGSTSGMLREFERRPDGCFMVVTECAMVDNLAAAFPRATVVNAFRRRCPHMEKVTLEHVRDALDHGRYAVDVPDAVRPAARRAVERMLALG